VKSRNSSQRNDSVSGRRSLMNIGLSVQHRQKTVRIIRISKNSRPGRIKIGRVLYRWIGTWEDWC